jgi:hypothetical protein
MLFLCWTACCPLSLVQDTLLSNARRLLFQENKFFIDGPYEFVFTRYGHEPLCTDQSLCRFS